jgi:hypothetical protein
MTLGAALAQLATWDVNGVTTSYAIGSAPSTLPVGVLPALVIAPMVIGGELSALDLSLTAGDGRITIPHALIIRPSGYGNSFDAPAQAIPLIDDYFTAVKADWSLNDTLAEPLKLTRIYLGWMRYGVGMYYAVQFNHEWVLKL